MSPPVGNKLKCQFGDLSVHICSLYNGKFMFYSEGIFLEGLGCTLLPQVLALLRYSSRRYGLIEKIRAERKFNKSVHGPGWQRCSFPLPSICETFPSGKSNWNAVPKWSLVCLRIRGVLAEAQYWDLWNPLKHSVLSAEQLTKRLQDQTTFPE